MIDLPTEILLQIFAFCIIPDETTEVAFTALHIVRISHVCHTWREVSLSVPTFWSNVAFKTPYLATTMLERSKGIPIAVRANLTPEGFDDDSHRVKSMFKAVSRAISHSDRAKEITLRSRPSRHLAKLFDALRPPSSQLELLSLTGYGDNLRSPAFDIPDSVFSHSEFPLRRLVLERCKVSPSVVVRHCVQLTHLNLNSVTNFNVSDVFDIFRASSSTIQSIILDNVPLGAAELSAPSVPFPQLSLLHLNTVCGDSRVLNVFSLLPLMVVAPDALLIIKFLIFGSTIQIPIPFLPTLSHHVSSGDPTQSLVIFQEDSQKRPGIRIQGWAKAIPPSFLYLTHTPPPTVDIHLVCEEGNNDALGEKLSELLSIGPLQTVQTLTIARVLNLSVSVVDSLLLMLPSLREIRVHGSSALGALCGMRPDGQVVPSAPLAQLRELRSINVNEVVFRTGRTMSTAGTVEPVLGALCGALGQSSSGNSVPLGLTVCYSDASFQDMEELAKHATLIWDGSTHGVGAVPLLSQPEDSFRTT
ncbi:hypothetical protein BC834DRAFT_870431 [Gloeopeniophorella convolvens]|nr:hypothetical protein BC834DRAFT_870431 [Gloeopeniophorella convolvens]